MTANRIQAILIRLWPLWLLFAVVQLPALRPFAKYVPARFHVAIPVVLLLILAAYAIYYSHDRLRAFVQQRLLDRWWVFVALIALVLLGSYFGFRHQQALQAMGRGSGSSHALSLIGENLLRGDYPYAELTFLGNKISPGVGWGVLNIPFTVSGLYFLLVPFWLVANALAIQRATHTFQTAGVFLLLSFSALSFWELLGTGSDLLALGCAISALVILLDRVERGNRRGLAGVFILVGIVATSRLVLFYVAPLFGYLLFQRRAKGGIWGGIIATVVMVAINVGFYLWNPAKFAPLHLIGKSGVLLGGGAKVILVLVCLLIGGFLLWKNFVQKERFVRLDQWLLITWLCLFVPLSFVAAGDLIGWRKGRFSLWEGANYISVTVPILITWWVVRQHRLDPVQESTA